MNGSRSTRRRRLRVVGLYIRLALYLAPFLAVFVYMISTSLKQPADIQTSEYDALFVPTLENYSDVFSSADFLDSVRNSLVLTGTALVISLIVATPTAWHISQTPGRIVGGIVMNSRLVPLMAMLIPWFVVLARLQRAGTMQGLILGHIIFLVPIITWFMSGFFREVPKSLIEAASIDGAGPFRTLWSIALPISRGALGAVAIIGFAFSWNNLVIAVALGGPRTETLPLTMLRFIGFESVNWGAIAAVATIMSLPVFVFAAAMQKQIIRGLTAGSVK